MRTFTDEGGNKFELDVEKSKRFAGKGTYVIKRIKAGEKADYALGLFNEFEQAYYWSKDISLTPPQAQKVADAIEALMELITEKDEHSNVAELNNRVDLLRLVDEARAAFQEKV